MFSYHGQLYHPLDWVNLEWHSIILHYASTFSLDMQLVLQKIGKTQIFSLFYVVPQFLGLAKQSGDSRLVESSTKLLNNVVIFATHLTRLAYQLYSCLYCQFITKNKTLPSKNNLK